MSDEEPITHICEMEGTWRTACAGIVGAPMRVSAFFLWAALLAGCTQPLTLGFPPTTEAPAVAQNSTASPPPASRAENRALAARSSQRLVAFPGAVGAGAWTRGALACDRPPVVLVVNQLGDDGDGVCDATCTLRDALLTPRPRFVVFSVSGTLVMDHGKGRQSDLELDARHACVTVAGQTSPGGVTLANAQLHLWRDFRHGIFRHLRIRPGIWEKQRGLVRGCNRWAWRCASDVKGKGVKPGGSEAGCRKQCGGRCVRAEFGEFSSPRYCPPCDRWNPEKPDAFPGCNDVMLLHGNFLDAFRVEGPAHDIILDSSSLTWAVDEALQVVGATPPAFGPRNITIQNSILGAGNDSDDGASGRRQPGHRISPHHYGPFITMTESGVEPLGMGGVTLYRNLMLHNDLRSPMVVCGYVEMTNNLVYNGDVQDLLIMGRCAQMGVIAAGNVFRAGPDTRKSPTRRFGHCVGGPRAGKPCRAPLGGARPAGCGEGVCQPKHISFIQLETYPYTPAIWLGNNRFESASGAPLAAARSPGLDGQWSRTQLNDSREAFHKVRATGAFRLGVPANPIPSAELVPGLLDEVGATRPTRDPVDQALVSDVRKARGGHGVPNGGYRYPKPKASAWQDADRDGICDGWERTHCEGGNCQPLADSDGDGYVDIEEWLNGGDPRAAAATAAPPGGGC